MDWKPADLGGMLAVEGKKANQLEPDARRYARHRRFKGELRWTDDRHWDWPLSRHSGPLG
jgi:hypothetical protein